MDASYAPPSTIRAIGNISIPLKLTKTIIPSRVNLKNIDNLYSYMDKLTALQWNEEDDQKLNIGDVKAMDYDLYDKDTGEKLYCLVRRQDVAMPSSRDFKWIMNKALYTSSELSEQFIAPIELNTSIPLDTTTVDKVLMKPISKILQKIDLNKIKVYKKQRATKKCQETRWTLTKQKFIEYCKNNTDWTLIMISMSYNNTGNDPEYLSIIKTDPDEGDIGVSYKYDSNTDSIIITGFHIDKTAIMEQHLLAMPSKHHMECNCLNSWNDNPNITHLTIGDPNQHEKDKDRLREEVEKTKEAMNLMISVSNSMINSTPNHSISQATSHLYSPTTCHTGMSSSNSYGIGAPDQYSPPAHNVNYNHPMLSGIDWGYQYNPQQANQYNNYNGFNGHQQYSNQNNYNY